MRQKTPNEIALNILLAVLTLVFLLVVVTLQPFAAYAGTSVPVPVLIALLVCLIPTTIGALISAIGIAGMDRLVQHNVLAMSGRAVEAAGDVDTLLLDKTGTITLGNRQAVAFVPAPGRDAAGARRRRPAVLAGRRDAGGPLDRRARQAVRHPGARARRSPGPAGALLGADAHVGHQARRARHPQGGGRRDQAVGRRARLVAAGRARGPGRPDRAQGRDPARGRGERPRTRAGRSSRTSSRAGSRTASRGCARWGSRPS